MTRSRALLVGGGLFAAMVLLFASYLVLLVASPYAGRSVPAYCSTSVSHIPSTARYDIPGVGLGMLLTGDAQTAVAVVADYGQIPFTSDAYVVSKIRRRSLQRVRFIHDVWSATIRSGTVYLFNDKILHMIDSGTGQTINPPLESDNYRGLYMSGGTRYVQTDFMISALGPGLSAVFNLHLKLAAIAFGCVIA
jgi:hypothetical protein